jgi:hypothetical protein
MSSSGSHRAVVGGALAACLVLVLVAFFLRHAKPIVGGPVMKQAVAVDAQDL